MPICPECNKDVSYLIECTPCKTSICFDCWEGEFHNHEESDEGEASVNNGEN